MKPRNARSRPWTLPCAARRAGTTAPPCSIARWPMRRSSGKWPAWACAPTCSLTISTTGATPITRLPWGPTAPTAWTHARRRRARGSRSRSTPMRRSRRLDPCSPPGARSTARQPRAAFWASPSGSAWMQRCMPSRWVPPIPCTWTIWSAPSKWASTPTSACWKTIPRRCPPPG
ncbi:hypothetical protein G6F32_015303 [Rhizopus arrhizus]|nr:hypothetical protein G6F32_015303 [Rhizopus arrhizus]